jgi:hypothetical protein
MTIKEGYTRVSQILKIVPDPVDRDKADTDFFFGLENIPKDALARKAAIGTDVHEAIDSSWMNIFFPLSEESLGYFASYEKWRNATKVEPIARELRMYNEAMKITGCVDMVGRIGNKIHLIDFKTSSMECAHKWILQASFYLMLLRDTLDEMVEEDVFFIKLDKAGASPKVCTYRIGAKELNAAISLYNLYQFVMKKR